jgi:hypothetical protein
MKRLQVLGLLAAAMLVQAPRLAMAQATFTLPSNFVVAPGSSGSFGVSVTTGTSYQVYGFNVDVVLTPVGGATGVTFTGASDSSLSSYLLNGSSDTLSQGALNTTTNQGGASTVINSPYYVTVPAGTSTLIQVNYTAAPTATGIYTIGFNPGSFNELTVNSVGNVVELSPTITSTVSAAIALAGDANLDGTVNFTDIALLAPNLGTTSGMTWANGDFNGDGAVNFTDVAMLAPNLGKSVWTSGPSFAMGAHVVTAAPEPASLALLALGGMLILPRRRARQN